MGILRVAIALVAVVGCGAPAPPQVPKDVAHDQDFIASSQRLRATLARDGIVLDTQPVIRTCDEPSRSRECARCDVVTVLDDIDPELVDDMALAFARYTSSMRKAARLEHVAFCRAITYERGPDHGPAGLADPNTHRVYISVEYFRGEGRGSSIEATVHHEVFHLLDFAVLGARDDGDSEWSKLNPIPYRDPTDRTERPPGFVNAYALTNEVEDRATTFAALMVRPDDLCAIADQDPVVARKVRLVWQRVSRIEGANRLGVTAPCALHPSKAKPKSKQPKRPLNLRLSAGSR